MSLKANTFYRLCAAVFLALAACPHAYGAQDDARAWKTLQRKLQSEPTQLHLGLLEDFIRGYPQSEYSAEARFAVAETLFASEKYLSALPHYNLLADRRKGDFAEDAGLRQGEIHYNSGDLAKARRSWEATFDRGGGRTLLAAEAAYGLLLCDMREKNYLGASMKLEKLVRQFPVYASLAKVRELSAILRFQEKNFHEAIAAAEDISTPGAIFYRGMSHFQLKRYLEAADAFEKLFTTSAGAYAETGLFFKAESFRLAKNSQLAAQAYSRFIGAYPASVLLPEAHIHLARSLISLKRSQQASGVLEKLPSMKGARPELKAYGLYLEAAIRAGGGDYSGAAQVLAGAFGLVGKVDNPELFGSLYAARGYYQMRGGDPKGAAATMKKLLYEIPHHPLGAAACVMLGNISYADKEWNAALSAYETALLKYKYTPMSDVALAMVLRTYYQAGRFQELVTNANRLMRVVVSEFPAQDSSWRSYAYFLLAEAYYKLKQYEPASAFYGRALRQPEWKTTATLYLAWSRYHEEKYPEALELAQGLLSAAGVPAEELASARFLLSGVFFNQKNYNAAVDSFRNYRKLHPGDRHVPESYFQEGLALQQLRFFSDALAAWGALVKLYPGSDLAQEAQLQAGRLYFQGRQYASAVAAFSLFLSKWPGSPLAPEAAWLSAQSRYNARQYPEAVAAYEAFLASYPKDRRAEDGRKQLTLAYFNRAMGTKSEEHLADFVRRYPKSELAGEAQYQLGQLAYERKDWGAAVREFRKLLMNYPGTAQSPMALLAVGRGEENLKRPEAALEEYESLLTMFPSTPYAAEAAARLGAIYFGKGKYKEAAAKFQFLAERAQSAEARADALYNMGVAYKRAGSSIDSLRAYEAFLRDYPADARGTDALLEIADINSAAEDHKKTIETYHRVLEPGRKGVSDQLKTDIYQRIGDIYLKSLNNKEMAKVAYAQLLGAKPAKYEPRLLGLAQLAALHEEKEDWRKALEAYDQIRRSGGRQDWVKSAAERAAEIRDFLKASAGRARNDQPAEQKPAGGR